MATKKLVCGICSKHLSISESDIEIFVEGRIYGLAYKRELHRCGFEGVFEDGSTYSSFLSKADDVSASLLAKYGFSAWRGKVEFIDSNLGIENRNYFRKILLELLNELDFILKLTDLKSKEQKIKNIVEDKLAIRK